MVAAGLLGGKPRPGLRLLFTRLTVFDERPRALFAQMAPCEQLLGEISPGEGTQVSMVAPGGAAEGQVAPPVIAAGLESRDIEEVEVSGQRWLVQRYPAVDPVSRRAIATFVLAHPAELGLAGLFLGARTVLSGLAIALAIVGVAAAWLARARHLSQAPRRWRARAPRAHP